jgi:hypothetical protein
MTGTVVTKMTRVFVFDVYCHRFDLFVAYSNGARLIYQRYREESEGSSYPETAILHRLSSNNTSSIQLWGRRRVKISILLSFRVHLKDNNGKNTLLQLLDNLKINATDIFGVQESPHEHQQNLLLSRIITNVVS